MIFWSLLGWFLMICCALILVVWLYTGLVKGLANLWVGAQRLWRSDR